MSFLEIRDLAKRFGDQPVLSGVDLAVTRGEILALLGPSGSGKTTLLRLLAGFERPDAGLISVDGEDVVSLAPARRGFGMVFQHYALFPHLTVGENVGFGLHGRGLSKGQVSERIDEVLALVDLQDFSSRRVSEISGGQQQRVALARALAPEPRLLLLDEPLSNLDPDLRERTRRRLRGTLRQVGITTVLVTHEQEEAFDLGDRVAVLHQGRLEQVDRPQDLYRAPATRFVAGFVGRASVLAGRIGAGGGVRLGQDASGRDVEWQGDSRESHAAGDRVELAVRPEALELVVAEAPEALVGRVVERRFSGAISYVLVELDDGQRVEVASEAEVDEGALKGVARRPGSLAAWIFRAPRREGV